MATRPLRINELQGSFSICVEDGSIDFENRKSVTPLDELLGPIVDIHLDELVPYILRRIFEVRAILEKLPPQVLEDSPLLNEAYGNSLYKCPMNGCSRFLRGFASYNLREQHLRSHERAHKCVVEGCDYSVIGFPTRGDLTKHKQLCHCEPIEEFTFPSVKRASLSQSLKDAVDRDDASAVRDLCVEMLAHPISETGFLFRAVKRKSFGAAFVLLELLGSDEIYYKAKDGRTVLHELVETMHVDLLKKILSTDIDVNAEDLHQRIPLSIALEQGNFEAARLLWSACDGKPKVVSEEAWKKGFVRAASGGHDDVVPWIFRTLVEHVKLTSPTLSIIISKALVGAASNNHETTIKIILDTGRALDVEKKYSKRLKKASCNGIEAIKLLEQPEIDEKGKTKRNALANAAQKDDSATVLRLLRNGADINNSYYSSGMKANALQAAAKAGNLSMVHLLLDNGADVNAQCGYYGNALQVASSGGYDQVVQILLDRGADINARGGQFGNALPAASYNGHDQVVQMLLDRGADINAQGGNYGNALQAASLNRAGQVVQMLLDRGADINAQSGNYGNALQAASVRGYDQVVQMLLNRGADVNAQNGHHGNALHAASLRGADQVVQLLLDRGADINAQGGLYGNALQAALFGGHYQTAELLRQRGAKSVDH
ncbi:MAG: hypothetical protein Q9161_008924 [Pseudevernia consocians]